MRRLAPTALVFALTLGVSSAAGDEFYDYVVVDGDSCVGIAIRELGDRKAYAEIHKHNKLGPLPHNLKAGTILRLPRRGPSGPDANLSARRGDVAVREAKDGEWAIATLGMDLFRQWRVNSRERSTAEIKFLDASRLRMRENTVVIIYGPTAAPSRRQTTRATLERGTLRTRLAELDGELVVETPSSEAALGSGAAIVSVDDAETARVSNHEGKPAKLRSRRDKKVGAATAVAPGMGSKVEKDKEPTPPIPLPPTPAWQAGPVAFAGWAHRGATLRGSWSAVDKAAEYRVEIARDDQGADVIANVTVPANVTAFEAHGFPSGDYYAAVAARDADAFESAPSPWQKLSAVGLTLEPFAGQAESPRQLGGDEALDPNAASETIRVLPGSRVTAPGDVVCATASGTPAATFLLSGRGARDIACTQAGQPLAVLPVFVLPVNATTQADADIQARRLPPGAVVPIRVEIAADVSIALSSITVSTSPGIAIVSREDEEGAIVISVRAAEAARGRGTLTLAFGDGGPELLTVPLIVGRVVVAAPPARAPRVRIWELGAMIGGNIVDDEFALGNSENPAGVLSGGWILGARLGLHFSPAFVMELEGTYGEPGFVALNDHANVVGYRVHAVYFVRAGRLRPFALGGIGGTYIHTNAVEARDDTDKEVYWGLGARLQTGPYSSVRLDLRHRVAPGRVSTFSNLFEASVGIGWML